MSNLFTPSATSTLTATGMSQGFSLGTVDAGNMSIVLNNTGPNVALYDWSAAIDPNRAQVLQPGQSVLIKNAGSQTAIALQGFPFGTTVVFQRGSVTTQETF